MLSDPVIIFFPLSCAEAAAGGASIMSISAILTECGRFQLAEGMSSTSQIFLLTNISYRSSHCHSSLPFLERTIDNNWNHPENKNSVERSLICIYGRLYYCFTVKHIPESYFIPCESKLLTIISSKLLSYVIHVSAGSTIDILLSPEHPIAHYIDVKSLLNVNTLTRHGTFEGRCIK